MSEAAGTNSPPLVVRLDPAVREIGMVGQSMRIRMRSWAGARELPFGFVAAAPVLAWLGAPGATLGELRHRAAALSGGWPSVADVLASLARKRLLAWSYGSAAEPPLLVEPLGGRFAPDYDAVAPEGRRLSRFAYLRRDGERLLLESPEVDARIIVAPAGQALLPAILSAGASSSLRDPAVEHLLACCGFLEPSGPEPADRRTWPFHDRLFHEETRANVSGRLQGGSYRFKNEFPSPPAIKPAMAAERIPLATPTGPAGSAPLWSVMEARVSRRTPGKRAVRRDDLAHLLWRVARVRNVLKDETQDVLNRPIPAGGSINELEFYLVAHRCEDLAPGLYHYVGTEHALEPLRAPPALLARMLDFASHAQAQQGVPPDCLIVLAARLPRLGWKYEGIAYRVALMNAGVAIDALYLVATDLGLSPCAVGTGNSALFEQATGLSPWAETAIAEFTINGPA